MELSSLYQDIILDHYRNPIGRGRLLEPLGSAFHVNPTCGDEITVDVARDADGALVVGHEGQGCSISQASASVMTELVQGQDVIQVESTRQAFLALMHSQGLGEPDEVVLGDGVAFAGVAKYPARVKCALLPWMALQDALIKGQIVVPATDTQPASE
ncbi:MAG: SUF system NifU family Fe-S cluster assembly protein [Actinomycetales bacterium]|nr:SUF system NifU family Fe-S cluster assembly protein [Actinomycetales bacterium]